ncbi:MAG: hypothetical protein KF830_16090 [Planctomycetes bacterium]|nr:hypothetical protein [Planctomycetota bacterium]
MQGSKVDKVALVCLLEATKLTLEHLAAHRLESPPQHGAGQGPDLTRLYGDMRRLRDYLQRCASARQEAVELDLSPADRALLVACCRRGIDAIELRLTERIVSADEKQWLEQKGRVLADQAVDLAAKPLLELPLPRLGTAPSQAGRALLARLQTRVFGEVEQRAKVAAPTGSPPPALVTAGVPGLLDDLAAAPDEPPAAAAEPPLVESHRFQDPRLRALVAMDLAALQRARAAGDHRLTTVLLASVLEAAVLDHAIPKRGDLGLVGRPDSWEMPELLERLMGDAFTAKDRAPVYQLFSSRNLLRPALQLVTPMVVTPASVQRSWDFAQRALHSMGFAGAAEVALPVGGPAPEGA